LSAEPAASARSQGRSLRALAERPRNRIGRGANAELGLPAATGAHAGVNGWRTRSTFCPVVGQLTRLSSVMRCSISKVEPSWRR
jgi:hypothetical protein